MQCWKTSQRDESIAAPSSKPSLSNEELHLRKYIYNITVKHQKGSSQNFISSNPFILVYSAVPLQDGFAPQGLSFPFQFLPDSSFSFSWKLLNISKGEKTTTTTFHILGNYLSHQGKKTNKQRASFKTDLHFDFAFFNDTHQAIT